MYVSELVTRTYRPRSKHALTAPEIVASLRPINKLRSAKREHFLAILLDTRQHAIRIETISIGSLTASIVHPREVFREAIVNGAASIILVHNHPSGDPEPSQEDRAITKRLVEVGELIGIGVLDHIIVAKGGFISFSILGLIPSNKK